MNLDALPFKNFGQPAFRAKCQVNFVSAFAVQFWGVNIEDTNALGATALDPDCIATPT